jgi:Trypsin-like peptidase domain
VVTNHHVIDGAKRISAQDLFGNFYRFESIFADYAQGDLVLLKFAGPTPRFLTLGSTATAQEGQRILVIGNPQGLAGTVSDGLISALRKDTGVRAPQGTAPAPGQASTEAALSDTETVARLVFNYMRATQNGQPTSLRPYCKSMLDNFYGKHRISLEAAEKDVADYYKTWPNQTTSFDPANLTVRLAGYLRWADSAAGALP